jgi:hypothetical protein
MPRFKNFIAFDLSIISAAHAAAKTRVLDTALSPDCDPRLIFRHFPQKWHCRARTPKQSTLPGILIFGFIDTHQRFRIGGVIHKV